MAQSIDQIRASVQSAATVGHNGAVVKAVERLKAEAAAKVNDRERAALLHGANVVQGLLK